ncbi:MAG: hypothetical protein ACYC61_14625 [Isosphaeraceae bacterium]
MDGSAAGKAARCKHCGGRFTIPEAEPAAEYDLQEVMPPPRQDADGGYAVVESVGESAFTPTRGAEPAGAVPVSGSERPARTRSGSGARKRRQQAIARAKWLGGGAGALALVLAGIALFAPHGVLMVAWVLMALGCVMILVGFAVGAFGAFSEDFLYGFLYVVIPCYAAYYMVTRWDDLWIWFACITGGVGLASRGVEMARWAGVAA